jgi:glucose/arabinose dehydrogenase
MRPVRALFLLLLVHLFSTTLSAQAPGLQLQSITSGRINTPTFARTAKDGTGRMFVLEQGGRILVVQGGGSGATGIFLDLTDRVMTSTERGLLGLAFHPDFADNRRFFVNYTRKPDGAIVLAEYHASRTNPNIADKQETVLLTISHPDAEHNGGMLEFGVDGFLYMSVGDGGPGNDPSNHAQDLNSLLGKILRIDIDHPGINSPYSSPASNPFYGVKPGRDEIYAFGFRNPWRFSFDSLTQELYVGDVGQDAIEEIDVVEAGGNYGWRVFEGWLCTNLGPASCIPENYISPIYTYVHTGRGGRCSITGGYVYRGNKQTLPFGAYVFGDYCTGEVLMLYRGEEKRLLATNKRITAFAEDEEGELYVVGGTVDRIVNNGDPFTPTTTFDFAGGGGVSFDTSGQGDEISVDHAVVHADDEDSRPAGVAFIELRKDGVLINETAVPATTLIEGGRFYAEIGAFVDTGVAFGNPDMARAASVLVNFVDSEGNDVVANTLKIPPGGQLAAFLDQPPFYGPATFTGSVTFTSSIPVSAVVLRGILNERSDFLTTTLPVTNLDSSSSAPVTISHIAAGGAWTTELLLLNPTDEMLTGTVRFLTGEGEDTTVTVEDMNASQVAYAIPPHGSRKLRAGTAHSPSTARTSVVTPDSGQMAPAVSTIYSYASNGITISTTGSGAVPPAADFDVYAQIDNGNSIETGVAIANPSSEPVEVKYELIRLDGSHAGLAGQISIGPHAQNVSFVSELPGASDLSLPFQGVLHLASSGSITALAIRGRYNERGEFLLSTTPPTDAAAMAGNETFIPQVVDGGGYSTEIVLYDLQGGKRVSGNIYFFDQSGQPVDPDLH